MPKIKVLFFVPHADDLEFGVAFMVIESLRLGYDVVEVLMTNCEYGTDRIEFKGKRLARIRKWELEKTVEVYKKYTKNELRIIRMGYIDGHLPLNESSISRVADLIKDEKPNIIFGPDPHYPIDFHRDHLNTGRNPYFAFKKLRKGELPNHVFFYYTFKPNFTIKSRFKNVKIVIEALSQHKSQISPFKIKLLSGYKKLSFLLNYFKNRGFILNYRKLNFINAKPEMEKGVKSIRDLIKYTIFYKWMNNPSEDTYFPPPKELGLI